MRHLVRQHGLDLIARHALQQAGGHTHQRRVLEGARGKGVRLALVDPHFRHADLGSGGQLAHRLHDPGLVRVARLVDHVQAHAGLGHGLAHQQRDDGAGEADHEGIHQQAGVVDAVGRQVVVHPQQVGHDAQHRHHGHVGQQEQENAFHGVFLKIRPSAGQTIRPTKDNAHGRGNWPEFKKQPANSRTKRGRNRCSDHAVTCNGGRRKGRNTFGS